MLVASLNTKHVVELPQEDFFKKLIHKQETAEIFQIF